MFFITEDNPRLLDEQFIQEYPALGMITTCNSGAYWGDGDARARATDYNLVQFAMESKARFSRTYKNCKPKPDEWEKAMKQLKKRNTYAIRLFLVYNHTLRDFAVSIPQSDVEKLSALGIRDTGKTSCMTRRGQKIAYKLYDRAAWNTLYESINEVLSHVNRNLDNTCKSNGIQ